MERELILFLRFIFFNLRSLFLILKIFIGLHILWNKFFITLDYSGFFCRRMRMRLSLSQQLFICYLERLWLYVVFGNIHLICWEWLKFWLIFCGNWAWLNSFHFRFQLYPNFELFEFFHFFKKRAFKAAYIFIINGWNKLIDFNLEVGRFLHVLL